MVEITGCDIHSKDKSGRLKRRIEVKSSLLDTFGAVDLTHNEMSKARNECSGGDFYIYHVVKLDADKYPKGPALLIYRDPYPGAIKRATPVSIRVRLEDIDHEVVEIQPSR